MKQIGKFIIYIYGFGANLLTYIAGASEAIKWLEESTNKIFADFIIIILNPAIAVLLLPYCSILLLLYATKPYRRQIGTHGIECNLIPMLKYKWRIKTCKLLHVIHKKLYHQTYEIISEIRRDKELNDENLQKLIASYLLQINHSLQQILKLDLTINIKRLSFSKNNDLVLTPYAHYRNDYSSDPTHNRNFDYKYIILPSNYSDEVQSVYFTKTYIERNGNSTYQANSIFNYLFSNEKKMYWMTNNLSIDYNNNIFYTSSNNFPNHYQSMAIFKIMPPEGKSIPEGIIIFDSEKKGVFSEKICAQIMGLIAHFLYEIFFEMNEYEKKRLQKHTH